MKVWNLFRKKSYKSNQKFELLIIDDETDVLAESLGIYADRVDEIYSICDKYYKESKKLTDSIKKVLREMNHINEVTYAVMLISKMHTINQFKIGYYERL
jgi:hypothetical protein